MHFMQVVEEQNEQFSTELKVLEEEFELQSALDYIASVHEKLVLNDDSRHSIKII